MQRDGACTSKQIECGGGAAMTRGEFAHTSKEPFGLGRIALEKGIGIDPETQPIENFFNIAGALEDGALFRTRRAVDVGTEGKADGVGQVVEFRDQPRGEIVIAGGG